TPVYQLVPGTTHPTDTVTGKRPRSSHVNSALSHLQLPESARAMGHAFMKLYVGLGLFAAGPNITPRLLSQIRNILQSRSELEKNGFMDTMIPSAKASMRLSVSSQLLPSSGVAVIGNPERLRCLLDTSSGTYPWTVR
ncbi:hypothetical protein BGZ65_012931, partial [Modicella reniformis]